MFLLRLDPRYRFSADTFSTIDLPSDLTAHIASPHHIVTLPFPFALISADAMSPNRISTVDLAPRSDDYPLLRRIIIAESIHPHFTVFLMCRSPIQSQALNLQKSNGQDLVTHCLWLPTDSSFIVDLSSDQTAHANLYFTIHLLIPNLIWTIDPFDPMVCAASQSQYPNGLAFRISESLPMRWINVDPTPT